MSARDEIGPDPRTAVLWARTDHEHDMISTRLLGFWLYMLSDSLIFAALFAAYGVLSYDTSLAGGPGPANVTSPYYAYVETIMLLTSVLFYGLAMVELKRNRQQLLIGYLAVSLLFGLGFLGMEWHELSDLAASGATPQRSGYLAIFFTLIAVHGIHIAIGLIWMVVAIAQVARQGLTVLVVYRLANLKVFWLYQALVWSFVFTFIYLRGSI